MISLIKTALEIAVLLGYAAGFTIACIAVGMFGMLIMIEVCERIERSNWMKKVKGYLFD